MNKLEYSALVRKKMRALKKWLTEHFGEDTAKKVLTGITLFGVSGRTQESIDYWGE